MTWPRFVYTSEEEAQADCARWQEILGVRDWEVVVRIARESQLGNRRRSGEIEWVLAKKMAVIKLLDPEDWDEDIVTPQNHKLTLVHELLHLHFAPLGFASEGPQDTAEEQAVHAISVAVYRGHER